MRIEVHLTFNGQCAEAFAFYQSVLGGEITAMYPYGDMPGGANDPATKDWIMHAYLEVGGTAFMGADCPPHMGPARPSGFCTSIQVDTIEAAQKIWAGLSDGAKSIDMPLEPTFWSPMFGMLTDKYEQPWMINTVGDPSAQ